MNRFQIPFTLSACSFITNTHRKIMSLLFIFSYPDLDFIDGKNVKRKKKYHFPFSIYLLLFLMLVMTNGGKYMILNLWTFSVYVALMCMLKARDNLIT